MADFDTKSAEYVFFFVIMGVFIAVLIANLVHACTKRTLGPSVVEQNLSDIQHDCELNNCQPVVYDVTHRETYQFVQDWPSEVEDDDDDDDEDYLPPTDDESHPYVEQVWTRPAARLRRVNDPAVDLVDLVTPEDSDSEPN